MKKCKLCKGKGYIKTDMATSNDFYSTVKRCTNEDCPHTDGYAKYVKSKYGMSVEVFSDTEKDGEVVSLSDYRKENG